MYKETAKDLPFQANMNDRGFLEWVPDGSLISAVPPECRPEVLEQKIKQQRPSAAQFGDWVQDYFNRCGELLNAHATGGLLGLIDFAVASYPFLENSQIKPMQFKFPDGRLVNGFIGVKDDHPRPWVIYKCGVFCSAEANAASLKNFMIHLFDQSPFNVIFVGNRTGTDFIKANKRFNFGGYFEHQDFIDLSRWLRDESPYAHLVSSVHVVAVSLAGSAAFLTEQRLSADGSPQRALIQSVTSLCAVSDLRPTVENMYANSLKGFIFSRLTWQNLKSVRGSLAGAEDLLGGDQPDSRRFPSLLGQLATRYIGDDILGVMADQPAIEKEKAFWERSQYSAYKHKAPLPLFIWASEDDSVVDYHINTGKLMSVKPKAVDPNLAIVGVPRGEHCGFATAYGYPVVATMLRSFVLNNSPEFRWEPETQIIPIKAPLRRMIAGERIINYWWAQGREGEDSLELNLEVYGADDSLCPEEWAYDGAETCRRIAKIEFTEEFFAQHGFKSSHNLIEQEALVRELNGRVGLARDGQSVIGASQWPNQIVLHY